jgi:DNA-binding CsgD family transcriptional regulator
MSVVSIKPRQESGFATGSMQCERRRQQSTLGGHVDPVRRDDPALVHASHSDPESGTGAGRWSGAPDLLLRVAERLTPTDGQLAREVYLEALSVEIAQGGSTMGPSAVCKAAQAAPLVSASVQPTDLVLDGLITRFTAGYAAALSQLRQALDAFAAWDDLAERQRWGRLMTCIAMDLWDDRPWEDAVTTRAARGQEAATAGRHAATVDAVLGTAVSTDRRSVWSDGYSRAVICNGLSRYEDAASAVCWAVERDELGVSGWALSELVEASSRTGHQDLANLALDRLRDRTHASGTGLALGIESRARALITGGPTADVHYRKSIEYLGGTAVSVHLARSHLVYGEWLRREGRRVDARLQLRRAQAMFDEMRSRIFVERTCRELVATGETVRKRTGAAYRELTPQEDQIARLASSRLTNSEIATRLFISPRTVEWHLRKVFMKLGVKSRKDLRDPELSLFRQEPAWA